MLLDACEEGDYVAVMACLQQPDAHLHLNLHGYARNVVAARCPDTGAIEQWGHPEALTNYRGDTPLRYAAFHGFARIVEALLAAGALPVLRNDDAKGAIDLAEYGRDLLKKKGKEAPLPADLPRGDPEERTEVIQMLREALEHQWVVINCTERPDFNGRIAQLVAATNDGRRLGIINDAAATASRPYYEKSAVTSAYLWPEQLMKIPPPPPGAKMKAWPLDARFCCFLAGCVRCECAVPSADTALHRPDSGLLRTERDEETGSADAALLGADGEAPTLPYDCRPPAEGPMD